MRTQVPSLQVKSSPPTQLVTVILCFTLPSFWQIPELTFHLFLKKYVVKHKSAKLLMMYAVGKLEAALNMSHLILSTSSQRVS